MSELLNLSNWHIQRDGDGIAWVTLDRVGESTNALSKAIMGELSLLLDYFERNAPKALVFRSGKEAGFIAGADVSEFSGLDSVEKSVELVGRGWHLFNRLAAVTYPTLALIRGHCLGGGLELSLACRYRVVVDEPGTRLGLPEVMLGIFPGWGGMLRLPQVIGPQAALDMMLTGKTLDAKKAYRMGLADACVPPRVMATAARRIVLSGQPVHTPPLLQRLFNGPLKAVIAAGARRQVSARARPEHYPAPYAIIDTWAQHNGNALAEPALIGRLAGSSTARNLIRVFFMQERLKNFGKQETTPVRRVHVVGAGVMGGDIAAWCALRGLTVSVQDRSVELIAPALARARKLFERQLKDPYLVRAAADRLIPDVEGAGVTHADLIIEAIAENLAAKQGLFRTLEQRAKPDALLATNTSSLRLEDIGQVLVKPSRLVGIHFFNPVARMPLVEVVESASADPDVLRRGCAFVRAIDKLPLPVKSAPGFLVNAVLAPYMLEAMRCVDEGQAPESVDAAMLAFGMPMGPIELADTVGLDVAMAAGSQLAAGGTAPRCLTERVARKDLGRKTGKGFYDWSATKTSAPRGSGMTAVPGVSARLVTPLIAAAKKLVADGVVADADLADAGIIFGTGFAPFTGGPLHYADSSTNT
jgi:3-hydroxyacyl-CoA dehydrogenase / enoyl-CoA hydratase / 3-hydroxybutyryl-CoA epimerase